MKNIIVFGGSGFLGSHVCDQLSGYGYHVTIYDIKVSPYLKVNQKMIVGDLLDSEKVDQAILGNDIVFNFAGIADIEECKQNALDTVKCNILGNTILLEASRKAEIKRFIFASSVYVYSQYGSFYRCSKQASESYVEMYSQEYHLPYTIVRFGSLYGERSDERNGIYRFLKQVLTENKIVHKGTGEEVREFIHVKDAAELCGEILDEKYVNQNIILTGHQAIKYKELFEMIQEIVNNKDIKIEYEKEQVNSHYMITPYSFSPKIGKKLTNNPYIDMGQGIIGCLADISQKYNMEE